MPDASHVVIPASPIPSAFKRRRVFETTSLPARPSMLINMRLHPIDNGFLIPFRPRPFAKFSEKFADMFVLIVDWPLGVDFDELENHRQRIVFADHIRNELL